MNMEQCAERMIQIKESLRSLDGVERRAEALCRADVMVFAFLESLAKGGRGDATKATQQRRDRFLRMEILLFHWRKMSGVQQRDS